MDASAAVVREYIQAWPDDYDKLTRLRSQNYVEEWPQSGERIRGDANWRAIHQRYPGGLPVHHAHRLTGSENRTALASGQWVLSPSFTLVHLHGATGTYTAEGLLKYPDGKRIYITVVMEVADGKIAVQRTYYAEQTDAPEWRSGWVERIEGS